MDSALFMLFVWLVMLTLIAAALMALARTLRPKKTAKKDDTNTVKGSLMKQDTRLDRKGAFREVVRLRDGGKLDECLIENMSAEERALFEIALIDALTEWPRDDQHKLRSALIKHGYDDQCARRLMKDSISSSVRASTLLALLRPQSRTGIPKTDSYRKTASGGSSRYS
ncbi:MAG TPA: hypothetical protein VJZ26_06750 [Blastocatellia bacterium]|nr:hypothetical protein [Blastocatellia bacterium]